MREIKFRAWDGERLRKVNTIGWVDEGVDFVTTPRYSGPVEDFILMQYADLKDKNDVEIYDGDVIRFILGDYNIREYVEEVVYSDGAFWCGNWLLFDAKMNDDDLEVLGNIYENPELLEREAE